MHTLASHREDSKSITLDDPDEQLIVLAKQGVDSAFSELCRRHYTMTYRVVRRILKNDEDAEDALQESFVRVYLHIASFDGRSKFSTWLTRIAINTALMAIRKRNRMPAYSTDELTEGEVHRYHPLWSLPLSPEVALQRSETSELLRLAIRRLPANLRKVTEIRHAEDHSVAEIAGITGLSIAATKSRLLRARVKLSEKMRPINHEKRSDSRLKVAV
jgi:RNA polymerase sigma-70 factor (ECF subfamily)